MPSKFEFDADGWVRGALAFNPSMLAANAKSWSNALDRTFEVSQSLVHVVTGFLKGSAHKEILYAGDHIEASIVYEAEYAEFEMGRGGSHDFLTPAYVQTEKEYPKAMVDAFEAVMATWR